MELLTPQNFNDYELIDCGMFEKLERFGKYITIRPEPQAVWDKKLSHREWEQKAHVKFVAKSSSSGNWQKLKEMPDRWNLQYNLKDNSEKVDIRFRLGLTSFKHVGIFPEQASNWDYIYSAIKDMPQKQPKFLNLFAYTGGASLAAKAAGADVVHVDSIKQVVSWARENMELSSLSDIRWVVEDALKFVKREVKRGNKYNGIILDPPAFGHGPTGEKWILEDNINEMIKEVLNLLDEQNHFLVLNTYSLGFSSLIIENLLSHAVKKSTDLKTGELFLNATSGVKLPLGVFGRFRNF
ncbi:MAG: class I SAM-dependent methyltransferase [Bacteroidetes bacterium]|nr:class I SAM-dependent methyltransferase [Bacteroidota bacterium]HET6245314.1 class I SAM-dependent methyltransferase [Bacteroidia bacterium]